MEIGLLDIDSRNFPNLALMKISSYHKSLGNSVKWANHFNNYDIVYKSKIFTYSPDDYHYIKADKIIKGGTGYDYTIKLPEIIDNFRPDYSIYPMYQEAYGFLTRGCPHKCHWCIVPEKEGGLYSYADIEDILCGRSSAILMDNNVLYSAWGIKQIEKIIKLKIRIDFNQGLDATAIDIATARLLSQVKWIRFIRLSCDYLGKLEIVKKAIENLNIAGVKNYKIFIYVMLYKSLEESYQIITELKNMGCVPFAQPYRNFTNNQVIPQWQKDMAQWVNKKSNFQSCDFKEYIPRKGFKCNIYFA